jgi:hypothetical protein
LGNFFSTILGTGGISPLPKETALCTKIPLTTFINPNDENLHDGPELLLQKLRRDGLPSAQDTGDEDPYIDTKDVLKLPIVGDSAVRLLITFGARSAW